MKLKKHGTNHKGVDWKSLESQELRFVKLFELIDKREPAFDVLDYGCGYGALLDYLNIHYKNFIYSGYDISEQMIFNAKLIFRSKAYTWYTNLDNKKKFSYVVASGLFNVKLSYTEGEWKDYIIETLDKINFISNKGFSFNILSTFSDKEKMTDKLFYADPSFLFNHCKKKYSKHVSLLHDYPLYEFTIIVKK